NAVPKVTANLNRAQKWLDNEILKDSAPYVPRITGALEHSGIAGTVIGSGEIVYNSPYARYQYYGKVMVDPKTGKAAMYSPDYGFWSRPGVKKVKTNRNLRFSTTAHSKACRKWFEAAKAVNKNKWIRGVQAIGGGGSV
ncbi:MAG: minor capsid protein, partial [Lawsonibacter sp.]